MKPTNLKLLDPKTIVKPIFKEVTSTDAFEGMTQNLNDDGLYSIDIFGKMGSKERDKIEAYIDVKLSIFNPTYFHSLVKLKGLYMGIIKGAEYAEWDPVAKDFIKSNILDGQTGFSFFMSHFYEMKPGETESYKRKNALKLISSFKDIALTDKVLVIPAGLRDIQFQPNGAPTEPEITEFYRKLMFKTRVVTIANKSDGENPLYDNVRWGLQSGFNDIDNHLFSLSEGKGGVYQKRMSTRGVVSGTRNVITARKVSRADLFKSNGVSPNTSDLGLLQAMLNNLYVCIHAITTKYLPAIFTIGNQTAKLVNPKTFEYEYVEVAPQIVEKWTTSSGLTKLINGFATVNLRNKVITIDGYFLALVYDDGTDVVLLHDINDLPKDKNKKYVRPITYMEFFYLSCQAAIVDQCSQQTRYPIIGIGSTFVVGINLLTISGAKPRNIRDMGWELIEECLYYPHRTDDTPDYFDAMSVDPTREKGLDSDHDFFMIAC